VGHTTGGGRFLGWVDFVFLEYIFIIIICRKIRYGFVAYFLMKDERHGKKEGSSEARVLKRVLRVLDCPRTTNHLPFTFNLYHMY